MTGEEIALMKYGIDAAFWVAVVWIISAPITAGFSFLVIAFKPE